MMTASSTNEEIYLVEETEYGKTPDKAAFKQVPFTDCSIGTTKNTLEDNTIRTHREVENYAHGTSQVGGSLNTLLYEGVHDPLLQAALMGKWEGDALTIGTQQRSFSVLRHFTDIDQFILVTGVELSNINLSVNGDGYITANYSIFGQKETPMDKAPTGATLTKTPDGTPFTALVGDLTEGGKVAGYATSFDFTLENGHEPRFVIGSRYSIQPKVGRANVNGNLGAYFETPALLNKYWNGENSSIKLPIENAKGDQYIIELHRVIYNGGQPDTSGTNDITLSLPFQAMRSSSVGTTLTLTRQLKAKSTKSHNQLTQKDATP